MKGNHLGELEELVLLTVGTLYGEAYSVAIVEALKSEADRKVNISAIHTVLYRLEEKGLLRSEMGEASGERGGKRKRLFYLTALGKEALEQNRSVRQRLWARIPKIAFEWKNAIFKLS